MKRIVAAFAVAVMALLITVPVLAAGFSISPASIEFDVPADGSTTVEFLVYDFGGDLEISLENIPLRVEPEKVSVVASEEGTPIELTFYGDESLGSQVFKGKICFLAISGGNIAFGIKVKATVNHAPIAPPPEETPPEQTPQETAPPGEALPSEATPPGSSSFPVLPVAGIAAGTAIVITLIIVFARRRKY